MASASIVSHSVPHFQVVLATKISQQEIVEMIEARNTLDKLQVRVSSLEASILTHLQAGAVVEDGLHSAEVKENSRRSPAWKDITRRLAQRLGLDPDAYVSNVIAHTKPSESFLLIVQ